MNRPLIAVGLAVGTALVAYERWMKPWQARWGATDEEVAATLPGDTLVDEPATQVTRAIWIDAPPAEVWPWIVQLGADRGGFYSYDWLEDVFGLGIHSASEIVEAWQRLSVGDLVYASRSRTGGWYVVDLRPGDSLVLKLANMPAGRPARRDEQLKWEFLWTFAVRAAPSGGTRLIVRERVAFDNPFTRRLLAPLGGQLRDDSTNAARDQGARRTPSPSLSSVTKYEDVLAVLKVVRDHEAAKDSDGACKPCDTAGLAKAMGLEPQEVADRLSDAERRGRMITAKKTKGETEPYFEDVRLTPNGRAAVAHGTS